MTSYTDVFGTDTIPPAGAGYESITLTANTTYSWPSIGSGDTVSKIMDITAASVGLSIIMPSADEVSTGEDLLIRNVGINSMSIKDNSGTLIATVVAGAAVYIYVTDNTTAAGVWGVVAFGVGTSAVDAATLVGYGIKAISTTLNQSHPTIPTSTGVTLDATYRAKLVVFTGGADTFALTSAATLGDDYFVLIRNNGTGTLTIDPASAETIDGLGAMQIQPSESLMLVCTGTQWYTVGYGRSVLYQFTQLTKDVSAGGTITLSAAEAANKLITFIGNPSGAVTVVVPAIVAVYYTYSNISTAQTITFKTASGSGVGINQGARIIAMCDGTNVVSAQSAVANSSVSLVDGSVSNPSLYFASQTNTGLYKYGVSGVGVAANGTDVGRFTTAGLTVPTVTSTGSLGSIDTTSAGDRVRFSYNGQNYVESTGGASGAIAMRVNGVNIGNFSASGLALSTALSVANGGTGATTAAAALVSLGERTSSTGSVKVVTGTTAQRDGTPAAGYFRFNTDTIKFEGYNGTAWGSIGAGAGATGAGSDATFVENNLIVSANYTIGGNSQDACTISIASPAVITQANQYVAGQAVRFTTTGTLPTGLSTETVYYIIATGLSTSSFQVSATQGGSAVNTSGTQSGVQTCGFVKNASSAGPIEVATGITVTVPTGSVWTVV